MEIYINMETLSQLAARLGRNYDTVYRAARRIRPAERWTAETPVPADVAAAISGGNTRKPAENFRRKSANVPAEMKPARSHTSDVLREFAELGKPVEPEQVPTDWRRILSGVRSAILIGIVLGHAALVWYDCSDLWATPGSIGGGLVFFIVLAAVMFAADPAKNRTSGYALWFVALVDAAAYFVHSPVFGEYGAEEVITAAICIFICAASWVALYLYQDQNLD
jgi:hypothetical protein